MNYAVQQRMRLIDFLLFHYGQINRRIIMDYFGIGEAAATRDIKAYKEVAPDNIEYSGADKVYKRTLKFERVYA